MKNSRGIIASGEYYHLYNHSNGHEVIFTSKRTNNRFIELLKYYRFKQNIKYSQRNKINLQNSFTNNNSHIDIPEPIIELFAFCLMPNHFHLLVKQVVDNGITKYLRTVQDGYAKYLNKLTKRKGSVFMRPYKIKRVENDNLFLHISRYIHLNPVTSYLVNEEELIDYPYTSLSYYLNENINEAPRVHTRGIFSPLLRRERNPSEAEDSSHSSTCLHPWSSAKGDKQKVNSLINTNLIFNLVGKGDKYLKFVLNHADYQKNLHKIKSLTLD